MNSQKSIILSALIIGASIFSGLLLTHQRYRLERCSNSIDDNNFFQCQLMFDTLNGVSTIYVNDTRNNSQGFIDFDLKNKKDLIVINRKILNKPKPSPSPSVSPQVLNFYIDPENGKEYTEEELPEHLRKLKDRFVPESTTKKDRKK